MRYRRHVLAVTALMAAGISGPAFAAIPANDVSSGATAVTLGFSQNVDTTEATTDAEDARLNICGQPATDASVWYSFVGTGQEIAVDVSRSDYSAQQIWATGSPGNLTPATCMGSITVLRTSLGVTYHVMVFDSQDDGGGNGGNLQISVDVPPPPPIATIALNPTGTVSRKTSVVTVGGTYACSNAEFMTIFVKARQFVANLNTASGSNTAEPNCDGLTHSWSVTIVPDRVRARFLALPVDILLESQACNQLTCFSPDVVQKTIPLIGVR
jgi:hypothetical protein